MKSIRFQVENEIIVQNSRFIGILTPVMSQEDIENTFLEIRTKYPGATHYCYAYMLGDHQEIQKASDDGEPQKTAGIPILDVLKKQDYTDVLCIVVRYFGGKLLGAGGLVRAYTKATTEVVSLAINAFKNSYDIYEIQLNYKDHHLIEKYLLEETVIQDTKYLGDVTISFEIVTEKAEDFFSKINNILHQEINYKHIMKKVRYE